MVQQALRLASENKANVSFKILNNNVSVSDENDKLISFQAVGAQGKNIDGDLLQVTYTNLTNSSYNGTPITKIVLTFKNSKIYGNPTDSKNFLHVYKNPYQGFLHATQIEVAYNFYDETGKLIDFSGQNNAWLSVNSLNSWDVGSRGLTSEAVKGASGVEGYQLKDSSIVIHDNGWAYSDNDNYAEGAKKFAKDVQHNGDVRYESGWDWMESPNFYYGSVLYSLKSSTPTLEFGMHYSTTEGLIANTGKESKDSSYYGGGAWAAFATLIPTSPGPKAPSVTYSLNDVTAKNPLFQKK
ncbi:GbpC/Spa domain-containing protein [Ligilactobacillus equi]|uniref:Glucan-binding protein C n=1 Tax=Ligilactobacillus equi DPC 6820 TaxID=1392007 RepID=V7HZG0_9LACO|nr:GbpC/Spa domain-containing protein [Ligilactobacillus equi]ETA74593.1 glucan-binding protein C [Ligilactobacillus equi DPC 6820]